MRTMVNGKARDIALGRAEVMSMAQAREMAISIRKALAAGLDPVLAVKSTRQHEGPTAPSVSSQPTFRDAWHVFWQLKAPQLASDKNRLLWINMMERYTLDFVGDRPVADIRAGGWFGGMPVKILYGVLGLALTIVTHSGVTIWLARRRDKGRPAGRWERIWAGVAWGQPFALAAAALAAMFVDQAILPTYILCTIAVITLPIGLRTGDAASRVLRLASGAMLAAVLVAHSYTWASHITDVMAWGVSMALLATAILLVARRPA